MFVIVVANVTKADVPGYKPLRHGIWLWDNLGAKSAPIIMPRFVTKVHAVARGLQVRVKAGMIVEQMVSKRLEFVHQLATRGSILSNVLASPHLRQRVLRVLMPSPVVATSETFVATRKGATIRPSVSFHVFTDEILSSAPFE